MNIQDKIEEIRQKPEHERMRYVWIMVSVSMFFVIIIWVVSLKDNLGGGYAKSSSDPIKSEQFQTDLNQSNQNETNNLGNLEK